MDEVVIFVSRVLKPESFENCHLYSTAPETLLHVKLKFAREPEQLLEPLSTGAAHNPGVAVGPGAGVGVGTGVEPAVNGCICPPDEIVTAVVSGFPA